MEDLKVDDLYKRGFEQAYWLTKGKSHLVEDIKKKITDGDPYRAGLLAGSKEAEREQVRERLQNTKDQSRNQERDVE